MSPAGSSTGKSARRSNSSAEIMGGLRPFEVPRFFAVACAADRDDADRVFMAIGHCGSPYGLLYLPNNLEARLVRRPRRSFEALPVEPERLCLDEVDPVLDLVAGRLRSVELEPHVVYKLYQPNVDGAIRCDSTNLALG